MRDEIVICPEHERKMHYELQPDWWRCPGCPVRVFNSDRRAYVPASSPDAFSRRYITSWHPLADKARTT